MTNIEILGTKIQQEMISSSSNRQCLQHRQLLQIGVTAAACLVSPMTTVVLSRKGISDKKDTVESSQAIAGATKKDDALPPTGESPVVVDPALTRCEPVRNAIYHLKQLLKCGPGGTVD